MSEVVVVALMTVKPGKAAEAEQILRALAAASQEEEGCLRYALHRGADEPNTFTLVERWRSREALDEHYQMPHTQSLGANAEMLAEPPRVVILDPMPTGDPDKGVL